MSNQTFKVKLAGFFGYNQDYDRIVDYLGKDRVSSTSLQPVNQYTNGMVEFRVKNTSAEELAECLENLEKLPDSTYFEFFKMF